MSVCECVCQCVSVCVRVCVCASLCESVCVCEDHQGSWWSSSYQGVEGGDGEDPQPAHGQLGGPRGHGQQPLGVWRLPALQAGQVAAAAEQVHVELLQVLLPQEDLREERHR